MGTFKSKRKSRTFRFLPTFFEREFETAKKVIEFLNTYIFSFAPSQFVRGDKMSNSFCTPVNQGYHYLTRIQECCFPAIFQIIFKGIQPPLSLPRFPQNMGINLGTAEFCKLTCITFTLIFLGGDLGGQKVGIIICGCKGTQNCDEVRL